MIDRQTIERIVETAKIEEVIGEFVSLKKRGANHIGCCPFHNEKTPSFYVSPSKRIYKCFGCGEAGDVVKFLMKHEHYTYPEALRWLAEKYNVDIKEEVQTEEEKARQTERDGLFHVSDFAQKYFAELLWNDEMGRAVGLSYFKGRGLSDEIIKRFGLGYCLDEWSAFTDHALKNGYSDAVLEKTGLTIYKEETGKKYDRFRGRVMFPIYSVSGRVLGFSGRVLSSEKQAAKYVNSPDSEIYSKSRILYGLYQARSAISRADKCFLVEGNIDVISMHQSGVENTVASCGTSLTVEQIRLIKRYTPNITVLYDGDSAGIKAALRAVDLLLAEGMHVRLVLFPDGEDPDSYAQKYGSTALQDYLASHEDNFVMFKTRVLLDDVKADPIKKASLISDTARTIALVTDIIEQAEYVRQCAQLLQVAEETLSSAVRKESRRLKESKSQKEAADSTAQPPSASSSPDDEAAGLHPAPADDQPLPAPNPVERHLVQLLLNYGNERLYQSYTDENGQMQESSFTVAEAIIGDLRDNALSLGYPLCQRVFEQCALMLDMTGSVDPQRILSTGDESLRSFAAAIMFDTYTICDDSWRKKNVVPPKIEDNLLKDVLDSINMFKSKRIEQLMAEKRMQLRQADPDQQMMLLAEIQQYGQMAVKLGQALGQVIKTKQY